MAMLGSADVHRAPPPLAAVSSASSSTASPPPPGRSTAAASASGGYNSSSRRSDPEYVALSELLSDFGEMDEQQQPLPPQLPQQDGVHNPQRNRVTRRGVPSPSSEESSRGSTSTVSSPAMHAPASGPRKRPRRSPGERAAAKEESKEREEREEREERGRGREGAFRAQETPSSARSNSRAHGHGPSGGGIHAGSGGGGGTGAGAGTSTGGAPPKHMRLADLEDHVRGLERENLHLKQALLLGKSGSAAVLASRTSREGVKQLLAERTKVVTDMVEQLNAAYLSLGDAARVWHKDCRVGVGVREWDARGRLETISLWNMIRSVFASIAVDIVELRPHLPDGEMMLTKWRIQGEIASLQQLEKVCASEDCPPTMRVALMAIKSSDLTFTVTTYVIFQALSIAEQHHCWDQVGVFKRLFGGEIPPAIVRILTVEEEEEEEEQQHRQQRQDEEDEDADADRASDEPQQDAE